MKPLLIVSLMIGVSYFSTAQTPNFSVTVSSDTINLSSVFEIIFTLEGEHTNKFQHPEFFDFDVLYKSQSTQMNITKGNIKRTISYTFGLRAKEEGRFVIEKATVEIDASTYSTDFIEIIVDENYTPKALFKEEEIDFWNPFEGFPKQEEMVPKPKKKRKVYKI
jgi:hypothetical protein